MYEEFKEETYGYRIEDEKDLGLKYFETFQFNYIGEAENGEIAFWISALRHGEIASGEKQKSGAALVVVVMGEQNWMKIDGRTLLG